MNNNPPSTPSPTQNPLINQINPLPVSSPPQQQSLMNHPQIGGLLSTTPNPGDQKLQGSDGQVYYASPQNYAQLVQKGFAPPLQGGNQPTQTTPKEGSGGFLQTIADIAPTVGQIGGSILGGITGTAIEPGGGTIAGGAAGGAAGQGLGEMIREWIDQNATHSEKQTGADIGNIAKNTGEGALFGAAGAPLKAGSLLGKVMPGIAEKLTGSTITNAALGTIERGATGATASGGAAAVGDVGSNKSSDQVWNDVKNSAIGGSVLSTLNLPKKASLDDLATQLKTLIAPNIQKGLEEASQSARFGRVNVDAANQFGITSPKGFSLAGLKEEASNADNVIADKSNQLNKFIQDVKVPYNQIYTDLKQILTTPGQSSYQARKLLDDFQSKAVGTAYNTAKGINPSDALSQVGNGDLNNAQVSLKDVNDFKKQLGQMYNVQRGPYDPINNAYLHLKDFIEKNSPDSSTVKNINKDLGQLIDIKGNLNSELDKTSSVPSKYTPEGIQKDVNNELQSVINETVGNIKNGNLTSANRLPFLAKLATAPAKIIGLDLSPLLANLGIGEGVLEKKTGQNLISQITQNGGKATTTTKGVNPVLNPLLQTVNRLNVGSNVNSNQ